MGSDQNLIKAAPQFMPHIQQPQAIMGNHQLVIISQLLQHVRAFRHIDEVFLLLGQLLLQRLPIEVIQFWAMQQDTTHQSHAELRTMQSRNRSLPPHVFMNTEVAEVAEHLLHARNGFTSQPITRLFSQHQATLFTDYNLYYCSSYFLCDNLLLPPSASAKGSSGKIATPFTMLVTLFFAQSPAPRILPTVGHIMKQALPIAQRQGLLHYQAPSNEATTGPLAPVVAPHPVPEPATPARSTRLFRQSSAELHSIPASGEHRVEVAQRQPLTLLDLVPRSTRINNPFSSTVLLSDQQTHRLYLTIDGQKNIGTLLQMVRMDRKQFYAALRSLLSRNDIQLYEPGGRRVDNAHLLQAL